MKRTLEICVGNMIGCGEWHNGSCAIRKVGVYVEEKLVPVGVIGFDSLSPPFENNGIIELMRRKKNETNGINEIVRGGLKLQNVEEMIDVKM